MTSKTLLRERIFQSLDSSMCDVNEAETLPPDFYTDPEFFEFEKDAVFGHEWLCVGRESWVKAPGDYFTTSHVGEPIVITRTLDGEIMAMSTVCRHRAMLVAEGRGHANSFMCPYHHWTYSLDGKLIGAPEMTRACNFDRRAISLPTFKVEVWLGFIFINFDLDAPPLAPRLADVTAALERHDIAMAEGPPPADPVKFPWNWKVMAENNNDGYHANRLHQGPLHDFIPSALVSFPKLPPDTGGYFRYNGTLHPDAAFNPTKRAVFKIFPRLTDEDRNRVLFVVVPPTLTMIAHSDMILLSILHADTVDTMRLERASLFAPGVMHEPLFRERLDMMLGVVATISAQDRHVDELVQIGLRSKFAPRGRYSWQEGAQSELNKWLVQRYRSGWNRVYGTEPAERRIATAAKI
jgi:phenylpropionate dioxygenase-like ring-hydroxylating dioxygenase large terminal subunit